MGTDSFTSTRYAEAFGVMRKVFAKAGVEVTHVPCHRVPFDFPNTAEALGQEQMPFILGYNRTALKSGASMLVANGNDPIIAAWNYGRGRALA